MQVNYSQAIKVLLYEHSEWIFSHIGMEIPLLQQGDLLRDNGTGQLLEVMGTKMLMGITHFELRNKTTLSYLTLSEHGIKIRFTPAGQNDSLSA